MAMNMTVRYYTNSRNPETFRKSTSKHKVMRNSLWKLLIFTTQNLLQALILIVHIFSPHCGLYNVARQHSAHRKSAVMWPWPRPLAWRARQAKGARQCCGFRGETRIQNLWLNKTRIQQAGMESHRLNLVFSLLNYVSAVWFLTLW